MKKTLFVVVAVMALSLVLAVPAMAMPGKPDFNPHIYADGVAWGTKVTTVLPAPSGNNEQSFDKFFVITNSNNPGSQLPVGEAAPGNPDYNGGRWWTHTVTWTPDGFTAHGTVPVLKSYADIMVHYNLGHLTITPGTPGPPPPVYFSCPLLPVK
jgi:hypothetical protein